MPKLITIEAARQLRDPIYIDLRSPSEFEKGRIPGAINIPLFSDEERAEIGTLHKQSGPEPAKDRGLAIASLKLHSIISAIKEQAATKRPIALYCWRGGMRSASVATIVELMGVPVYRLDGGYKAYRHFVLEQLEAFIIQPQVVVLCGSTGVGKTTLLQMLSKTGVAVIDLEGIANHRGSAFGHVGLGKPSSAQNFDSILLDELMQNNDNNSEYDALLLECESKRIGNVYLPDNLYQAMQRGKKILVSAKLSIRSERLIQEYLKTGVRDDQAVINSIQTLAKRLGEKAAHRLIELYQSGNIKQVVETLLVEYYDPLYGYEQSDPSDYDICVNADNLEQAVRDIRQYLGSIRR